MTQSRFPWYDSLWLNAYVWARETVQRDHPDRLSEFLAAFEPLKTKKAVVPIKRKSLLDPNTLNNAKAVVRELTKNELERHEFFRMGRHIVHDHAYFTELQNSLTERVSDMAGEELEPRYNFLSLYSNLGACQVHMDSPESKWTLDVCLEQSDVWPIHISQTRDWPEDFAVSSEDWIQHIKEDPKNAFRPYALHPGDGVLFSGSSQWHYRDPIAKPRERGHFCHLIFFHYIPRGTADLLDPRAWASRFDIPELARAKPSQSQKLPTAEQ